MRRAASWPSIRRRLARAGRVLLCCDLDGTLAPIAPHPSRARVPAATRAILRRLADHPRVSLAFISGRRLADARRLVGIRGAYYAGNHGLELAGPGMRAVDPAARRARPALRGAARRLARRLQQIPGAWLEDKGLTLSVHTRQATARGRTEAARLVRQVAGPLQRSGRLRFARGKMVWDIRPAAVGDKGTAIERLAGRLASTRRRLLIVCLGDDRTDEDAFRAVNRRRGLSLRVGPSALDTRAGYRLRAQSQVLPWLTRLLAAL
jgi:trehalose 6-phosphate phosphatase